MSSEIIFSVINIYLRQGTENGIEIKIFTKYLRKPSFAVYTIENLKINNELNLMFTRISVLFVIILHCLST